jgi:hypothetical protein
MLRSFVLHHSIIQGIQTTTTKITNTQLSEQWTSIERIEGLQWAKGTVVPGESPRQWLGAIFGENGQFAASSETTGLRQDQSRYPLNRFIAN